MADRKYKINTNCVHGGYKAGPAEPQTPPIAQSTTFRYYDNQDVADWFNLDTFNCAYTRLGNPTVGYLEEKMTLLEGGSAAVAASAGMSATLITILALCEKGDNFVASQSVYGGTYNLFDHTFEKMGIECRFIDQDAPAEEIEKSIDDRTRAIFAESLGNPALTILDFEKFSKIAKKAQVPLVVDNTLASPVLCRPIEHGADIVIHSTTKYCDGHANCVGGMVIESGEFDWFATDKYPGMTQPDESYHGMIYGEKYKELKCAFSVKLRAQMLRDLGCAMSPMNAYLTWQGLQTLPLRMARHSENALKMAQFLSRHPKVDWVQYPGLKEDKYYELGQKYMPDGQSGVLSFGVKGGKEAGEKLLSALELTSIAVHVGDVRTCVLHPASSTHRQMTEEQQIEAGIKPELIRLSVGIEDIDDIIRDFEDGLAAI